MKAVITVTAKDSKGIIAKVSTKCYEYGANILDISQTIVGEYFAMLMLVQFDDRNDFGEFVDAMSKLGTENGLVIQTMHEDIFNSMHKI